MGTPNNWGQVENAGDWMRQQEKRVMHEARRPRVSHASDIMGPGVAPTAVEINDWSGPVTEFNGWFWSRPGAAHAPDGTSYWMGQTITQAEGYGVQEAYDYRGSGNPVALYTRRFSLVGGTRLFSPWQVAIASSSTQPVTSVAGRTGAVVLVASDITGGIFDIARIPTGTTGTTVALGNHTHDTRYYQKSEVDTLLAGKSPTSHTHTKAQISDFAHTHPTTEITGLGTAATKNTPASGNAAGTEVVLGSDTRLTDARTPTTHTHTKSQITDLGTIGTAAAKNIPASGNAASTEVVMGNDTRLTDARTPTAHTHVKANITDFAHTHAIADLPVAASGVSNTTQVVRADDARLSDARTPTAHTHTKSQITDLGTIGTAAAKNAPASGNAASTEVVLGNDTRLTDARTPTAHTHTKSQITDFAHTHAIADLPVAASGVSNTTQVVRADDARLSDSRPPTTHAWTHGTSGGDPITPVSIGAADENHAHNTADVVGLDAALAGKAATSHTHTKSQITDLGTIGTAAAKNVPASGNAASTEVVMGNDTRLTDSRTPTAHTHTKANITDLGTIGTAAALNVPASGDAAAGEVVKGSDTRLTNARTPTAHTHNLSDLNATGTRDNTTFLRGDGVWIAPPGGGGVAVHASTHASGGSDPVSPASIGAAAASHTHTKSQITDFAHTHPVTELQTTGTPDGTKVLRDDGAWVAPPDGNPVGTIIIHAAGVTANFPPRYIWCDGSALSTTGTYAALFAVIGYQYGGSGSTFNLPDTRRRWIMGADGGPSGAESLRWPGSNEGGDLGQREGAMYHSHSHTVPDHAHGLNSHTHTAGSLSIASAADRAAGGGNRGANPVSGVTGGPNTSSNGSGAIGTTGVSAGSANTGGVASNGAHAFISFYCLMKF